MTEEMKKRTEPSWLYLFILGVSLVLFAVGVQFTAEAVLHAVHVQMCPRDTFFAAAMANPHSTFIAAAYFLCLPVGMFVALHAELVSDLLRGRADWDGYRRDRRTTIRSSFWIAVVIVPIMVVASQSYVCLTEHAIIYRPSIVMPLRTFAWTDVQSVSITCSNDYESRGDAYLVALSGGPTVDLSDSWRPFVAAYPRIQAKLSESNVAITVSGAERDCGRAFAALLHRELSRR